MLKPRLKKKAPKRKYGRHGDKTLRRNYTNTLLNSYKEIIK